MKRIVGFAVVVAAALVVTVGSARVAEAQGAAAKLVQTADGLWEQRATKGMADKAIETYQQALAVDDAMVDVYWKLARAYYFKGRYAKGDAKKQKMFREGIEFTKLAIEIDAKNVGAHFWLAVCYGSFGEVKGIMQSLHLVDPMKKELEIALKLDPKFEDGGSQRVLSRMYRKLPGFKGGDVKKAVDYGRKAVKRGPKVPMNHLFLAEALIDDDKKDEARTVLETCVALKVPRRYGPEGRDDQTDCKKLLGEL